MIKLFTDEELAIIAQRNTEDLGALKHLTDAEILQLKAGENVTLGAVVRARAILSAHYDGKLMTGGYVSRAELDLIIEEHNNLATKTMLIFEALVRRNLITEKELFDIAAELRGETTDGEPARPPRKARRAAERAEKKKAKAVVRKAVVAGDRNPIKSPDTPTRSKKGGAAQPA